MNALVIERFVRYLEEDITHWQRAAEACKSVIPALASDGEKRDWRLRAANYLSRVESHRALIEVIRTDQE